jgi:hypothetical protein
MLQLVPFYNNESTTFGNHLVSFPDAFNRYSTFGRELLAVYLSIRHFRHHLEAHQFFVLTDHKPLTYPW